jgi:tyrosine-protein kinase Etk/Wzc
MQNHNEIPLLPQSKLPQTLGGLEEEGVSIRDYVDLLWEGRKTILWSLGGVLLLTVVYLIFAPRTYKADGLVRIDKNKALLAATLHGDANKSPAEAENPRAQREVEIMRSRSVLGKVVDSLNLSVEAEPDYFPLIGETLARGHDAHDGIAQPWFGFSRWAWGGEKLKLGNFQVPERFLGEEFTLIARDNNRFTLLSPAGASLVEGTVGTPYTVEMGEGSPLLVQVAELKSHPGTHFQLVRRSQLTTIDNVKQAITVKEASKDTDILSIELKGRDPEQLARSVNDIATTYVNATVNWESAEAEQKLSFLESQLPIVKERLERSEQALSAFRQQHGAVDISTEAEVLLKQTSDMENLGIQLRQKYEEQNQRLEDAHPDMMATKAQIARVEKKLADLSRRIKDLPRTQQNMVGLARDVQVNTELYTSLLNSAQEQRVAAAGSIGNSRIVDFAAVPEKPSWPRPGLLLAIASVFGFTAGAATVMLKHSLQRHNNYPAMLESKVGIPLFAAIPHSKTQRRLGRLTLQGKVQREFPAVLASQDPGDVSIESLRGLRTMLEANFSGPESKVLMVCSPAPGMGKSFVSVNLAILLASIKKRVLVIDGDLRNGHLHDALSVAKGPGLTDLMEDSAALGDVVTTLPNLGVDFLPRGRDVSNPSELLTLGQLESTLEVLKSFYNHIVIDSPPILGATDAAIIGQLADATFLVVKEGRYTAHELEVSYKRFQQVGIKPDGFIINDMKEGSSYYPYYGHAYPRQA